MNPFLKHFPQDDAQIEKSNGTVTGLYVAQFSGDTILFWDTQVDIQAGDVITRKLPNGKEERSLVTDVTFFKQMHKAMPAHYQIKFTKEDVLKMQQKTSPNVTIHNAGAVQIGDHNTQNIVNAIQDLQNKIDTAAATPEQKAEAKSLLSQFLSHPVTVAILGGLSGGLVG